MHTGPLSWMPLERSLQVTSNIAGTALTCYPGVLFKSKIQNFAFMLIRNVSSL
uniref:Uncharacterized protein n=1 Tax=Anguilla anguilla TaxID=7936 RepID=A0A0E9S5W3_ANGAN